MIRQHPGLEGLNSFDLESVVHPTSAAIVTFSSIPTSGVVRCAPPPSFGLAPSAMPMSACLSASDADATGRAIPCLRRRIRAGSNCTEPSAHGTWCMRKPLHRRVISVRNHARKATQTAPTASANNFRPCSHRSFTGTGWMGPSAPAVCKKLPAVTARISTTTDTPICRRYGEK
ncbi:hypothetical protein MAR_017808 [Mya arenaria]|uniref:Uncharacterized protein n=1 Tax=Mya arenaria TaxID=6604 RepID=A0ABY7ECV9_MYAAR|nr:hypothetical protein MAR_017808 [Mya arenaria]